MKRQAVSIIDNFGRLILSGMALCGALFFFAVSEAAQFPLYVVDSNGLNIPGDAASTNLPAGNTTTRTNTTYLSLLSTTAPTNGTTQIKSTWTPRRAWYSMAKIYYNNPSTSSLSLSANATGTFFLRSTNTLDQYRFTLRDYNPAVGGGANGAFIAQSPAYASPSTSAATSLSVAFGNAQYTLPAGHYLEVEIEYWPRDTANVGYVYCNSTSQSRINIELRASIVSSASINGSITGPATTPGTAYFDVFPLTSTTYTITADSLGGYQIQSLLVDGSPVAPALGQTTYTYPFTNINSNHTISVSFVSTSSTLIISTGTGGTTSLPVYSMTWLGGTTSTYTVGTSATLSFDVIPDLGYGIDSVYLNTLDQGVPQGQTTTFTIPVSFAIGTSSTLSSSFKRIYTVNTSVNGTGGSISPLGSTAVLSGGALTIDVTPDSNHKILSITDDGVVVGNTSPYTITNITKDHDVVVTYAPVHHITAISGPNGTISPIGDVVVDAGADRNFSFTPDVGYRVNDVLIDGVSVGAVAAYTFTSVAADHTIEVTFVSAPIPSTYCAVPAFMTTPTPPNVMLMLSVETPMQGAANPTVTCTGTPSSLAYTCSSAGLGVYDDSRIYYGYFDSNKCYTYSGSGATGLFTPSGAAVGTYRHQCAAGTAWSGNMLNYGTMLAVDAFRKAFTGGNRVVDTTTDTVLLGAINDGGYFAVYPRVDNAELYMPVTGTGVTRYLVRKGGGSGFGLCAAGQTSCTVTRSTTTGEGQWPVSGANTDSVYSLRIKACDPTGGSEIRCNSATNKPEGTIQKYMDKMRFALMSYAAGAANNVRERDGGVLREKMKWVGPVIPNGLKYHDASNDVVTCSTAIGCSNPEKEVNTDGTFVNNPDGASTGNSGLINYLNKFAYTDGYKSYDPISEMYYQVLRYFRNQIPSTSNYCNGLTEPNDNFPLYCNSDKTNARGWRDPSLYSCSKNFVIAVNDANPHVDKRIPGTHFIADYGLGQTAYGDWCGSPRGACDTDFTDSSVQVPVETWTKNVGDIETLTGKSIGHSCEVNVSGVCMSPVGTVGNLGRVIQSSKGNSYLISGLAYYAHMSDLRSDLTGTQNLTTYMIDTQEPAGSMLVGPKNMLQLAAKYGGFDDKDNDGRPYMNASCGGVSASPNSLCAEWDADNDGYPDNYFFASDSGKVETSLYKAFASILNRATSGTAAAVANNRSGERGANIIQALFYPQWPNDMGVKWLGDVQALWFYLDPIIKFSGIFEDSDGDRELNLRVDLPPSSDAQRVKALWKAGEVLHARDASTRSIYTLLDPSSSLTDSTNQFNIANRTALKPLLGVSSLTDTEADVLINYIRGVDGGSYRSRTVTNNGSTRVWKLGDIINSTPQIQGGDALNNYNMDYGDTSYKLFTQTSAYKANNYVYTGSNDGMLHAFRLGLVAKVNDPTNLYRIATIADETDLGKEEWAFIPSSVLPFMKNCADTGYCHQYLVDGTPFIFDAAINKYAAVTGEYAACTESNYWSCKRQRTSWSSVLIGSMGLGGASRDGNCNETLSKDSDLANNLDCIKTPVANSGLSSYFALDITTPLSPKLMWEFSDASISNDTTLSTAALKEAALGMGLTTPGPAIVRINSPYDNHKNNGRWFAVFASGPTGTIDTATKQFMGRSDQNLKIYVVDINPFESVSTFTKDVNYWVFDTGKKFAFASSVANATVDVDKGDASRSGNWSDDVIYITYTKASLETTNSNPLQSIDYPLAWDKGGIIRLITNNDPNPANWFLSTLIDDIGPVTRSVDTLQSKSTKKLWVYFGEGRYFFTGDDLSTRRKIYGIADPCYSYDLNHINAFSTTAANCPTVTLANLKDQTSTPNDTLKDAYGIDLYKGWYIQMDNASGQSGAERLTGGVSANTNGVVFYSTFVPSTDLCVAGGVPSGWAVNSSTGGTPPAKSMQGKIVVTTSDQPIAKPINIPDLYNQSGNRKMSSTISNSIKGMPPPQPPPSITLPSPTKRILNIQER